MDEWVAGGMWTWAELGVAIVVLRVVVIGKLAKK